MDANFCERTILFSLFVQLIIFYIATKQQDNFFSEFFLTFEYKNDKYFCLTETRTTPFIKKDQKYNHSCTMRVTISCDSI